VAFGLALIAAICLVLSACGEPWTLPVSSTAKSYGTSSVIKVSTPVGPQVGKVNQVLTYTVGVNSSLGEGCKYGFNWGDGSYTWSSNAIASHSWPSSGMYIVRAQVRNEDVISEWSNGIVVMVGSAAISRSPLNDPEQAKKYITPDSDKVETVLQSIMAVKGNRLYSDFDLIREWVAANIDYKRDIDAHSVYDFWQLPMETLERRTGDCEDLAILLCSMLRAYGIQSDDIYIAIGTPPGTDNYHAYLFERHTKGAWRAIEPQIDPLTSVISFELIDWMLTYDYSGDLFCFNDKYFFRGIPDLGSTVYEAQIPQSFWPFVKGTSALYERKLEAGERVEGVVEWLGSEKIIFDWELSIYDSRGDIVLNWSGKDKSHDFSLKASAPGIYRIEILKRDFVARHVKLSINPPNWNKIQN
jgi:hypothetical protein